MIVLDTNVISELLKPSPSPAVATWLRSRSASELYTTAVNLAEIRYGVERLADGKRKRTLRDETMAMFARFPGRVLSFDERAAEVFGLLVADNDRIGPAIDAFDAQIASICRARDAALATRDIRDFEGAGIELIDPWRA